jgi:hypothetical protein
MPSRLRTVLLAALLACCAQAPAARDGEAPGPAIAIIIDDIGYRLREDRDVVALPGPLTLSILPHSPHGPDIAARAVAAGKHVMLHLPMEPERADLATALGPGALTRRMDRIDVMRTLNRNLRAVPGAIGVNNHMGSLLTQDARHMRWLMESLRVHDLFFVDSVTTERSVAFAAAGRAGVPALRRDVFLDDARDVATLREEFAELIRIAQRRGTGLAIGHPHPDTIALLRELLPQIGRDGVQLVSVPELLHLRGAGLPVRTAGGGATGAGMH